MSAGTSHGPVIEVRVLGPVTVIGPDGPLDPGGRKLRLLLALLVASGGQAVTYDRLIDGLWGEEPPASAKKSLQVHISNLRHGLGDGFPLRTVPGGYLIPLDGVDVDARRFEVAVDTAARLVPNDPAEASRLLTAALGWWSGPAYADVAADEGIRAEATRLDELRLRALELRNDADLRLGRHNELIGELETLAGDHPYRERFQAQHMLALYRAGRQAEAVRAFDRTRRILVEELGLEPSAELAQLHQEILEQSEHLNLGEVDGAADHVAPSAEDGVAMGRHEVRGYELRDQLGQGPHGTVYRAFQRSVAREVALKVIRPELANDPEFVRRFEAECRTIDRLEHPHIVTLLDYWRDPSGAYLAMPLMRGGSVAATLGEKPWPTAAALKLVEQVGSALGHAHRRGVTHGDLTPSNVLLDEDGNAYVSDFGTTTQGRLPAERRSLAPTPHLARPAGTGAPTGPAADICALALLTREMLAGRCPAGRDQPIPTASTTPVLPPRFDSVFDRATNCDPEQRYGSIEEFLIALRRAFGAGAAQMAPVDSSPVRNPYKGLRAFGEADAPDFFGRDTLLAQLVEQVGTTTMTTLVGPSGCGKSSLVNAGLIPIVRRDGVAGHPRCVVAEMCPGTFPFEELEASLLRVSIRRPADMLADLVADERGLMRVSKQILPDDTDLLLVIDQFEELFAPSIDVHTRELFLANLATVAADERSRARLVLTIRADYFDRPLRHAGFGRRMHEGLVPIAAPTEGELVEVIMGPAEEAGLELEPGLLATILRDLEHEPGALPLLEYALTELVDAREDRVLTVGAYQRIGGVIGALARRADEIYCDLPPGGRDVAREILLRLVQVGDEGNDTRRRVRRSEIEDLDLGREVVETVVGAFGSFRLLTFDRDPVTRGATVEVAHEALLREWPRYRAWIDDRREDLLLERRLAEAAAEWIAGDRDRSLLFRGAHLDRYEQWASSETAVLTTAEHDFLDDSRAVENEDAAQTTRRRRNVMVAISALAIAACALALVALIQRNRADDQSAVASEQAQRANAEAAAADTLRVEAERTAAIATAQLLASQSATATDADLALLLAIEANEQLTDLLLEDPVAHSALQQAIVDHNVVARIDADLYGRRWRPAVRADANLWSSDGEQLLLQPDANELAIVDIERGDVRSSLRSPEGFTWAHWDSAANVIYTASSTGIISVWDPESATIVDELDVSDRWVAPFWTDGEHLMYLETGEEHADPTSIVVVDLATEEIVFESPPDVSSIGMSSSGDHFAVGDEHDNLLVYRTDTWDLASTIRFEGLSDRFDQGGSFWVGPWAAADWVAGKDQIWIIDEHDRLSRVDALSGERLEQIEIAVGRPDMLAASPDENLVAMILPDGSVMVHDTTTGELITRSAAAWTSDELPANLPATWVEWSPDGGRLFPSYRLQGGVISEMTSPSGPNAVWPPTSFLPATTAVLADGNILFGSALGGGIVTDPEGVTRWTIRDHEEVGGRTVVSSDGSTIVSPEADSVAIRDANTGAVRAYGPNGFTRPLAVSSDGAAVLVATSRGLDGRANSVALVNGTSGEITHTIGTYINGEEAAFTADGSRVVVPIQRAEMDGPLQSDTSLWVIDVATGDVLASSIDGSCTTTMALSADDRFIAAGNCDGSISLYDTETLLGDRSGTARIASVDDEVGPAEGLVFDPTSEVLVATFADGKVRAWSAGEDMSLRWSLDVGVPVGAPNARDGDLWFGVMQRRASGQLNGGGAIGLPFDRAELLEVARSVVTRDFTEAECRQYLGRSCAER